MSQYDDNGTSAVLIRLAGYTAHFRDPRTNTAKIGLPARTLRCPPPCTIHGLLCAARGAWIEPEKLRLGWRIDYANIGSDFQTCQLPQRKREDGRMGPQTGVNTSPVKREILEFPVLTMLAVSGVDPSWFRKPANPLSLGRSEDLIVEKKIVTVKCEHVANARLVRQCLPLGVGSGTIYPAPLYFTTNRNPIEMSARIDAERDQLVRSEDLFQVTWANASFREAFYVWKFGATAR